MSEARIGILMGSNSDFPVMEKTGKILKKFGVRFEMHVMSAHRTPELVQDYVKNAPQRGIQVFIAAAGGAAHLAGAVAAHTTHPVIGVPLNATSLNGMDALLSTVQMPPGMPVATVAVGEFGAVNAALLAIQILALNDSKLASDLQSYREEMKRKIRDKDDDLQKDLRK